MEESMYEMLCPFFVHSGDLTGFAGVCCAKTGFGGFQLHYSRDDQLVLCGGVRSPLPNSSLPDYGDITGLTFWTGVYLDGGAGFEAFQGNVNAIADFFVASDEFQARYSNALSNIQFVTTLYENMLGRSPDLEGLDSILFGIKNAFILDIEFFII